MSQQLRVVVIDDTQNGSQNNYLSTWWRAGSWVMGGLRRRFRFDHRIYASNPSDVYRQLGRLRDENPTAAFKVQSWSHGGQGEILFGGKALKVPDLASVLGFTPEDEWWIRGCECFQGVKGWDFALELTRRTRGRWVGHTRVVSGDKDGSWGLDTVFYQSGCYGLRPGEAPHWSTSDEGGSSRRAPNTVLLLRMDPPSWCYQVR